MNALEIQSRVKVLGKELTLKLQPLSSENNYPVFIGLMNDCFMFFADLIRVVNMDLTCDFIDQKEASFLENKISGMDVKGKNIVLVLGTPVELKNLKKNLLDLGASSITTVCFSAKNKKDFDYLAFETSQKISGYGLNS